MGWLPVLVLVAVSIALVGVVALVLARIQRVEMRREIGTKHGLALARHFNGDCRGFEPTRQRRT